MKFTKSCAIESATAQPANRSRLTEATLRKIDENLYLHSFQCYGYPKESMIRCYNRCHKGSNKASGTANIPENHLYQYTSGGFYFDEYRTLSTYTEEYIRVKDFGYGKVEEKDKKEELKFWKECVTKGVKNSTSKPINKEAKGLVEVDLNCDQSATTPYCRFVIEYTLDGIKSITSDDFYTTMKKSPFYARNTHSCRIFEKKIECISARGNIRYRSLDHIIESIYLLGRDKVIRGEYPESEDRHEKEYHENIPKVLEMLQKFRADYPKDIYGSNDLDCPAPDLCTGSCYLEFEINSECDSGHAGNKIQFRKYISPHRFVDSDRTGSIALEIRHKLDKLSVYVFCKMGCIAHESLYASIMDVLSRQMETKDDIIFFESDGTEEEKNEYLACVYYSVRSELLKRMYDAYKIPTEQPKTIREANASNGILSLIISTIFASIIVVLIISIIIIGTISYLKNQTKKQPITLSKKTVIARRKNPKGKSAEFGNSKDKTGDFYDFVSKKTSTVNNTDLASTVEDPKSRD